MESRSPADPERCEEQGFYADCLRLLEESRIPYLVAGSYAVCAHTGLKRASKDLDIFCKAGDYPRISKASRRRSTRSSATRGSRRPSTAFP